MRIVPGVVILFAISTSVSGNAPPVEASPELRAIACKAAKSGARHLPDFGAGAAITEEELLGVWHGESQPNVGVWGGGFGGIWEFHSIDPSGVVSYEVELTPCTKCRGGFERGTGGKSYPRTADIHGRFFVTQSTKRRKPVFWLESYEDADGFSVPILFAVHVSSSGRCYGWYGLPTDSGAK